MKNLLGKLNQHFVLLAESYSTAAFIAVPSLLYEQGNLVRMTFDNRAFDKLELLLVSNFNWRRLSDLSTPDFAIKAVLLLLYVVSEGPPKFMRTT